MTYDDIVWSSWIDGAKRDMWEHSGSCMCGKRTMLFGQCFRCMREEEKELNRAGSEGGESSALAVSVLEYTPGPKQPDLTFSGLRELFSAPEPLPRDFVPLAVRWKEDCTMIAP